MSTQKNNITKGHFILENGSKLGAESDLLDKKIKNEAFFE